jgi:hypothetical protein
VPRVGAGLLLLPPVLICRGASSYLDGYTRNVPAVYSEMTVQVSAQERRRLELLVGAAAVLVCTIALVAARPVAAPTELRESSDMRYFFFFSSARVLLTVEGRRMCWPVPARRSSAPPYPPGIYV